MKVSRLVVKLHPLQAMVVVYLFKGVTVRDLWHSLLWL